MSESNISPDFPFVKKRLPVLDSEMAYVDEGSGPAIVFLHGNPTSSYLWRNVIPQVLPLGRCLAPDLIGMGDSGTMPSGTYRYPEQIAYLDAWFESLELMEDVILVLHDWGGALGFNRFTNFPESVSGIAYCEVMVRPRLWTDLPEERRPAFKGFRTPEGERGVLQDNVFVERLLFQLGIVRELGEAEKAIYRRPYMEQGESRRPTLAWPQEIPFDGEPADNFAIVQRYTEFMNASNIPKLFIRAEQGHALTGAAVDYCRQWTNQTEVSLPGKHFLQEDYPRGFGDAVADFARRVRG